MNKEERRRLLREVLEATDHGNQSVDFDEFLPDEDRTELESKLKHMSKNEVNGLGIIELELSEEGNVLSICGLTNSGARMLFALSDDNPFLR